MAHTMHVEGFTTTGHSDDEKMAMMIEKSTEEMKRLKLKNIPLKNTGTRQQVAATAIQSLWRGYRSRHSNKDIKTARLEIRAKRAEDHIAHLQANFEKFIHQYDQERKLRLVQMEAVKFLLKEVDSLRKWQEEVNNGRVNGKVVTNHTKDSTDRRNGNTSDKLGNTGRFLPSDFVGFGKQEPSSEGDADIIRITELNDEDAAKMKLLNNSQKDIETRLPENLQGPHSGSLTPPCQLTLTQSSETTCLLEWRPSVSSTKQTTTLIGYRIYMDDVPRGMVSADHSRALLHGMDPHVQNRIYVRAVTELGESNNSNVVMTTTLTDTLPTSIRVRKLSWGDKIRGGDTQSDDFSKSGEIPTTAQRAPRIIKTHRRLRSLEKFAPDDKKSDAHDPPSSPKHTTKDNTGTETSIEGAKVGNLPGTSRRKASLDKEDNQPKHSSQTSSSPHNRPPSPKQTSQGTSSSQHSRPPSPKYGASQQGSPPSPKHGATHQGSPPSPKHGTSQQGSPPSPKHGATHQGSPPSPKHGTSHQGSPPSPKHGTFHQGSPPSPKHGASSSLSQHSSPPSPKQFTQGTLSSATHHSSLASPKQASETSPAVVLASSQSFEVTGSKECDSPDGCDNIAPNYTPYKQMGTYFESPVSVDRQDSCVSDPCSSQDASESDSSALENTILCAPPMISLESDAKMEDKNLEAEDEEVSEKKEEKSKPSHIGLASTVGEITLPMRPVIKRQRTRSCSEGESTDVTDESITKFNSTDGMGRYRSCSPSPSNSMPRRAESPHRSNQLQKSITDTADFTDKTAAAENLKKELQHRINVHRSNSMKTAYKSDKYRMSPTRDILDDHGRVKPMKSLTGSGPINLEDINKENTETSPVLVKKSSPVRRSTSLKVKPSSSTDAAAAAGAADDAPMKRTSSLRSKQLLPDRGVVRSDHHGGGEGDAAETDHVTHKVIIKQNEKESTSSPGHQSKLKHFSFFSKLGKK